MYKVLLVDDERIIRDGISKMINWEALGLILAGTAKNGLEAYEFIKGNPPDIVITDIKMPDMDGLELISRIREENEDIHFIILSGYGEFDFASRAMKHGIRHYLLKPCNEEKIIEVLKETLKDIKSNEEKNRLLSEANKNLISQQTRALNESSSKKHGRVVNEIIKCIEENIGNEDLSLNWIAEKVMFMNVDYLGKTFYRELNEKFPDYVLRVRMEKAKELMESEKEYRFYEISEMVGIPDNPQYFSQLFKKYTGYTPTEYRKMKTGR
jgi:YesN/AraC family two-component response regulator